MTINQAVLALVVLACAFPAAWLIRAVHVLRCAECRGALTTPGGVVTSGQPTGLDHTTGPTDELSQLDQWDRP